MLIKVHIFDTTVFNINNFLVAFVKQIFKEVPRKSLKE